MFHRSVFYLPKPRPLNYLVGGLFQGPTLVLNGSLDPLNNAVARAQVRYRAFCYSKDTIIHSFRFQLHRAQ